MRVQACCRRAAWGDVEVVEEDEGLGHLAQARWTHQAGESGFPMAAGTLAKLAHCRTWFKDCVHGVSPGG
jgi:hypothetical protein